MVFFHATQQYLKKEVQVTLKSDVDLQTWLIHVCDVRDNKTGSKLHLCDPHQAVRITQLFTELNICKNTVSILDKLQICSEVIV